MNNFEIRVNNFGKKVKEIREKNENNEKETKILK